MYCEERGRNCGEVGKVGGCLKSVVMVLVAIIEAQSIHDTSDRSHMQWALEGTVSDKVKRE